jgi:hypothetical protein
VREPVLFVETSGVLKYAGKTHSWMSRGGKEPELLVIAEPPDGFVQATCEHLGYEIYNGRVQYNDEAGEGC